MIQCTYPGCNAQYRRKEHLTRHTKKHYPSTTRLTCEICHKSFDRTDSLRRHKQLHAREGDDAAPRTSKACDQCHSSKTRCDGGQPCAVCARRGGICTFERLSKRNRTMSTGPTPPQYNRTEDIQNALELHRINAEAGIQSDTDSLNDIDDSGYGRRDPNYQRTEMEDLMLQHENQLREQGLLASRCSASGGGKAMGNGDLDTDHYIDVYFSHFHYQWPMLHCRSFRLSNEPQILFLAVVMIGLWVTGESSAQARAESMHEKLVTLLENQMNIWQKSTPFENKEWPFTTYQTIILNVIFAMTRHNTPPDLEKRCRSLLLAVTITCVRGGLFKYPLMRSQIEPTDSVLFTWTYMEEIKRLALTIFKLNLHFNTGVLTLSDLEFPPPDNGYLWDAPDSKEFYRRYNAQLESGTAVDGNPYVCEIVRGLKEGNGGNEKLGILLQADPWIGLVVQQARSTGLL
ncbi:Zn(II)2Cys6 transcription factor [Aspergillus stella-maris]|uniref:Zn(II)2Cys6 transcription factor n=1 Tax=Aspergillus stella-maris TaxID=1810926 RepID=UPI003CCD3C9C